MTAGRRVVKATVLSQRGAVREHNEDAALVGAWALAGHDSETPYTVSWSVDGPSVIAVADGLGGEAAGEVAAELVVCGLAESAGRLDGPEAIDRVLVELSDRIWTAGEAKSSQQGMGSTVVGLVIDAERTEWFNVGDSPLLRYESGYLGRLYVDDSPRDPTGEPGADVIATSVVTQVLGSPPHRRPRPHTGTELMRDHQRYLLCSDGLTNVVSDEQIERILAESEDDDRAVRTMWAVAMNAGGPDNITIALVSVNASPGVAP